MRVFLIALLLLTFVEAAYAIQRPEETCSLPSSVLSKAPTRATGVCSEVSQEKPKTANSDVQKMASRKSGRIQSSFSAIRSTKKEAHPRKAIIRSKKSLWAMSGTVYETQSSRQGSLSQYREATIFVTQQMQLCNRLAGRVFEEVPTSGEVSQKVETLACAMARAEGYWAKGAIPNRTHNPGDIRAHRGVHYPGQIGLSKRGYVIFKSDAAGWSALYRQIEKVISGESQHYTVNMTLKQFGKEYAASPIWSKNVSRILGTTPSVTLWEILDIAPVLEASWTKTSPSAALQIVTG